MMTNKHDFGKPLEVYSKKKKELSMDEIAELKELQIKCLMKALEAMQQDTARIACIRYLNWLGYDCIRIT